MEELKQLFQELIDFVKQYGHGSYSAEMTILKRVLYIIDSDESDAEKFSQIKYEYDKLFIPRTGGLGEFNIWREDFEERKKANEPLDRIRHRLWEIFR